MCVAVVAVVVAGDGRGEFGMERLLFFSGIVKKFDSSLAP